LALHFGNSNGGAATLTRNQTIGCFSRQKFFRQLRDYGPEMHVNGATTILGLASWTFKQLSDQIDP